MVKQLDFRATLMKALRVVNRVVERRTRSMILSHVLLTAGDGVLTLRGTDLDLETTITIPFPGGGVWACAVDPRALLAALKLAPSSGDLGLAPADGSLHVICGGEEQILPTRFAPDYPPALMGCAMTKTFHLSVRLLKGVVYAVSTDDVRYYLNGVYLHARGNALRAVATDGKRMAIADSLLPVGAANLRGIIIPTKTVGEIIRACRDAKVGAIRMEASASRIRLTLPGYALMSKTVDGTFPDYEHVIPKSSGAAATATVDTRALLVGLARQALDAEIVELVVTPDVEEILLIAGAGREATPVAIFGRAFRESFKVAYLLDAMRAIEADRVELQFHEKGQPLVIRALGDHGGGSVHLVTPYRK